MSIGKGREEVKGTETIYGLHAVRVMLERHPERVITVRLAERRDDPRVREIDVRVPQATQ